MSEKKIWKKYTFWAVLAVIALWATLVSREADAETILELAPGVAYAGTFGRSQQALIAAERISDSRYEIGVILIVDPKDRKYGNRGVSISRCGIGKKWEACIGYTWWAQEGIAWNATDTFQLVVGHRFNERLAIRLRHWSTGGTSGRNAGMDMLTVGYAF